jgi:hypothetical protein
MTAAIAPRAYRVTRLVHPGEPNCTAGRDVLPGTVVFQFLGATWGCCDLENGIAVTDSPDGHGEFYELPRTAVKPLDDFKPDTIGSGITTGGTVPKNAAKPTLGNLTVMDMCDYCHAAQALIRLYHATSGGTLDFCLHDYTPRDIALMGQGWTVVEDITHILVKPS